MEYLDIMAQTGNKELALGLISIVESRKIPVKPVMYNPLSIAFALDPEHDISSWWFVVLISRLSEIFMRSI